MLLEFDNRKSERNIRQRGLGLERFADIDLETAVIRVDTRREYGEPRLRVWGMLDGRLHVAVVTPRGVDGERMRVISLRRANEREERMYVETRQSAGSGQ